MLRPRCARAARRALALHQISMEECSKLDMLGAAAMSLVMGHPLDLHKLATAFRQHEVKNYNNAYMSVVTDAEREARKIGDVRQAGEIFEAQQAGIHRFLNTKKNASLYVDFCDGKFISPSEQITEEEAMQFQQLNAFFLSHGSNHLGLLSKIANDPDAVATRTQGLVERLVQLKASASAGDLDQQFQEIVAAWLEEHSGEERGPWVR
jgi:AbiV family abortive infection protein